MNLPFFRLSSIYLNDQTHHIDQHENHDNNGHFDNHGKNHQEGRLPLHYAATREELKPIYTALVNKGECLDHHHDEEDQ